MKLKKFVFPGAGRSMGPIASIGVNGAVNLSAQLTEMLGWNKPDEKILLEVYTDEEQETIEQELIVYVAREKDGSSKLGRSKHGATRINLGSLMKEVFPMFECGRVNHRIEKINKVEFLVLTIPYGTPVSRLDKSKKRKKLMPEGPIIRGSIMNGSVEDKPKGKPRGRYVSRTK